MKKLMFLIALSLPGWIQAHPGHGVDEGWSILHYTFSAEHAIPLVLGLVAGVILWTRVKVIKKIKKDI
ncbi:MAG: hypothetical protein K9I85_05735 [Saprospiraceae bacterium]|nr:hypothetical protein [Saprospiraceae bacterium]